LRVVGDDLLGQRNVALGERGGRLLDRDRDHVGDLGELRLQLFEGLVEHFAHVGATFRRGVRHSMPGHALARPERVSGSKVNEGCREREYSPLLRMATRCTSGDRHRDLYCGGMDSAQLALFALAVGALIGAGTVLLVGWAYRVRAIA